MTNRTPPDESESVEALRAEAACYSRYLSGAAGPPDVIERYVDACRRLLLDKPVGEDGRLLAFVRRHPLSLPALDAACGIVRPGALLRRKLFLMLALLETSPALAPLFIARRRSFPAAVGRLSIQGLAALVKIVAGLAIFPLARAGK